MLMMLLFLGMISVGSSKFFNGQATGIRYLIMFMGPMIWMLWGEFLNHGQLIFVVMAAFVQAVTVLGLLAMAAYRYGRQPLIKLDSLPKFDWDIERGGNLLPAPLKSERAALFWMQFRQSVPVVIAGLVIFSLVWGVNQSQHSFSRFDMFETLGPFIGCVLALLIGIGSFVHELEPQLYTFWRSRPISPTRWFWLKYFAGAIVVIGCFDLPLLALARITNPPSGDFGVELFPILLHLFVYSFSVLAACAIRHPVYSPILAVCGMLAFLFGPEAIQLSLKVNISFLGAISFFELWRDFIFARYTQTYHLLPLLVAILLMVPIILFTSWLSCWLIKKDISFSP